MSLIIVGAGITGSLISNTLKKHNIKHSIFEKSLSHGRMSTKDLNGAKIDIGAQFFTVRSPVFQSVVDEWISKGLVKKWTNGFPPKNDNYPRYCGINGMMSIVSHYSGEELIRTKVSQIKYENDCLVVDNKSSKLVVMTQPIPQALELCKDVLDTKDVEYLSTLSYYPCITLYFNSSVHISESGAYQHKGEVIDFICSNFKKGISTEHVITLHCSPKFSEAHFNYTTNDILAIVAKDLYSIYPTMDINSAVVHKWKYAQPKYPSTEPFYSARIGKDCEILFAGDQFCNSKIEGACLSALATAKYLLKLI